MTDLRSACDRCHDKKLRCPKLPGASSCSRCAKAGAPCIFSPPTRSSFAGRQAPSQTWPDVMDFEQLGAMNGLASQIDPSFPGFSAFGTDSPSCTVPGLGHEPEKSHGDNGHAASDEMIQLTSLMLSLDGINRNIPRKEIRHVSAKDVQQWVENMHEALNLPFSLERILNCSQLLITFYSKILEVADVESVSPDAEDTCSIPDCLHQHDPSRKVETSPTLDFALLNLLLACHSKSLDIMQILSDHGNFCGQVTAHLPSDVDPKFDIPETRIGSFVAPKSAAASMFLAIVAELQGRLVGKTRELETFVTSKSSSAPESRVLVLQCQIIRERSQTLMSAMNNLRDAMMQRGVI